MVVLPEAVVDMEGLRSDEGRAEDPFRMELAEAGPLGKPLHGNESERSFFYFQGSLFNKADYGPPIPDGLQKILDTLHC
ncbi:MAG: hypothetical protein EA344_12585 [Alkalicoccus sp.]|nr:MAG: hypothetical protein EA344_12585 [Alkalicoccus sp.]